MTLRDPWVRVTMARSPTSTSINVVSGPIVAPAPTDVAPSRNVPGNSVTSGARSTELCTQVVAGSVTVTPACIQSSEDSPVQFRVHRGELDAVVDTLGLPEIGDHVRPHRLASPTSDAPTTSVR